MTHHTGTATPASRRSSAIRDDNSTASGDDGGDDYSQHPLWETQITLERGMLRAGADAFRDRVAIAARDGSMTDVRPVQGLLDDWLPEIGKGVRDWCSQINKASTRGVKPIALSYLSQMDPYVAALIALRSVLDGVARERQGLVGLATEIGRECEHEQRIRTWEANDRDLFYTVQRPLQVNKSTPIHRRRVNLAKFNSLMKEGRFGFGWVPWTREVHLRVGLALIDVIVRHTLWFTIAPDPHHVWKGRGPVKSPMLTLQVKPQLTAWLAKALDAAEINSPQYKPTVIPPKRWTGSRDGGYYTHYVRTPRLVRFRASQESQQDRAADEYDAIDMPEVYSALHALQETAWKVDGYILDTAKTLWAMDQMDPEGDRCLAGLPKVGEYPKPPRTARMELHRLAVQEAKDAGMVPPEPDPETALEILAWKRQAAPIWRKNAKRVSRARSTTRTIVVADEYREFAAIYFPHMLDFRGRMYPIPHGLQPQGDDIARGILTFAEGCPVDNVSAGWIACQLASAYGDHRVADGMGGWWTTDMDKEPVEEKIAWVADMEDTWRAVASDPIANRELWHRADKPFQCLAAILEWVKWLDAGPGFVSHLPCMVDGTCNGIQHLAAITRDQVAGELVNLVPGPRPRDIYKHVAELLQAIVEGIEEAGGEEGEKAAYWLKVTHRNFTRKLTKRQVMVLPYGGTKDSYFTYTREILDEKLDPPRTQFEGGEEERKAYWKDRSSKLAFLVKHMWAVVSSQVAGGVAVMDWLKRCARCVVEGDQPIFWVTPSGMVVRHFYGVRTTRRVQTKLDGQSRFLDIHETTNTLDVRDQLTGVPPNFIHSLDASALVTCVNQATEAGIWSFAAVHDAYGTHAANMWPLYHMIRDSFVWTHQVDVLGLFRAGCARVLVDQMVARGVDYLEASEKADAILPAPLPPGSLDLEAVRESTYFFL